ALARVVHAAGDAAPGTDRRTGSADGAGAGDAVSRLRLSISNPLETMMSAPPLPAGVKILTVSELTGQVKNVVEDGFAAVWVSGEVSGWKKHTSGHCYLKLRDAGAVLCAVIYRGVALRMRFDPKDGMEVIARGRLSVYPPQGQYQMSVEELHPKGLGAQELALQQLKQKLSGKGYFLPQRKRALPRFPRRVALVTSPTGAAVR